MKSSSWLKGMVGLVLRGGGGSREVGWGAGSGIKYTEEVERFGIRRSRS